jgi:SOS-response transcriptional repressor LexA
LKALDLTQTGLAAKLGLSQGVISEFASGSRDPSKEFLLGLPKIGVSVDWFLTGKGEMFSAQKEKKHPLVANLEAMIDQRLEKIEIRLAALEAGPREKGMDSVMFVSDPEPEYDTVRVCSVDDVAAGPPIPQSEDLSNYVNVPRCLIKTKPEDYYAAHIQGQSMTAAGIPDECRVLIRKSDVPRNGAIQVVRHGGRSTLKRLREHEDHRWTLHFEDNTNRSIEVGPGEDYQVQGDFIAILQEEQK